MAFKLSNFFKITWTYRSVIFSSFHLQASFNFERMQAMGWTYTLYPMLKKHSKDTEDFKKKLGLHLQSFNTYPLLVTFILGKSIQQLEQEIPDPIILQTRTHLMGPLGGYGDLLVWFNLIPMWFLFSLFIAHNDGMSAVIFFGFGYGLTHLFIRVLFFYLGYTSLGSKLTDTLHQLKQFLDRLTLLTIFSMLILMASHVSNLKHVSFELNYLLDAALVLLVYHLMRLKKVSLPHIFGLIFLLAWALVRLGF